MDSRFTPSVKSTAFEPNRSSLALESGGEGVLQADSRALSSGAPVSFSVGPVSQPTLFSDSVFWIDVPAGAGRLQITLVPDATDVDLDLFVRRGVAPGFDSSGIVADFSALTYTGYESVTASLTSEPPLAEGTYYITLALATPGVTASGTLTATYSADPFPGTLLTSGTPSGFGLRSVSGGTLFTGNWVWRIDVPADASRLELKANALLPDGDVDIDLFVRRGAAPTLLDGAIVADYRSTGPFGSETVVVDAFSTPPLQAGSYFVALALFTTGVAVDGLVTATWTADGGASPSPELSVEPISLTLSGFVSGAPPSSSFQIRNSGSGSLSYTVATDQPWLQVNPSSGVSTGETNTIMVLTDISGLSAGSYLGRIAVWGDTGDSQHVNVTLSLSNPQPELKPPTVSAGGVVNAADFTSTFAPGMLFSIFGVNLAPSTASAQSVPLPQNLAGTSVEVVENGLVRIAPLLFVSTGQINAQLPFGITAASVDVRVRTSAGLSNAETISIQAQAPRLFSKSLDGQGEAIVVHGDYSLVSGLEPARAGEWVVLYLTGLGAVSPAVEAGQAAGDGGALGELNRAVGDVTVTVGAWPAQVYYAGLAPGFVGLYQINFQIPASITAGSAEIVVDIGGEESQESVITECALSYAPLTSATLGPSGGRVSVDDFTMHVPAGALDSSKQITLYGVGGSTYFGGGEGNKIYGIEGLSALEDAPLTVVFDVSGESLSPEETYVARWGGGGRGGLRIAKATVDGTRATATFEPAAAAALSSPLLSEYDLPAAEGAQGQLVELVQLYRSYRTVKSPNNLFQVTYPAGNREPDEVDEAGLQLVQFTAEALEEAVAELDRIGFDWKSRVSWPISAALVVSDEKTVRINETNTVEVVVDELGEVRRSPATAQPTLLIDTAPLAFSSNAEARALLHHLVAHLMQSVVDPSAQFRWKPVNYPVTSWTWFHEAVGTWLQLRTLYEIDRGEPRLSYGRDRGSMEFLLNEPLEIPANEDRYPDQNYYYAIRHGRGASMLLEHLEDTQNGASWLAEAYKKWSPFTKPTEALQLSGLDVTEEWIEFCRSYAAGYFHFADASVKTSMEALAGRSFRPATPFEDETGFSWIASDLMALVHRERLATPPPEGNSLVVSLDPALDFASALVYQHLGDATLRPIGEARGDATVVIDNPGDYTGSPSDLFIFLVNGHAQKPFVERTLIGVNVKVAEDEPVESELLEYIKSSLTLNVDYAGWALSCDGRACAFIPASNVDLNERIPIEWTGRSFRVKGQLSGSSGISEIEISGTLAADALVLESARFYRKDTSVTGTVEIGEIEVANVPFFASYPGPLDARNASYVFQVNGQTGVRSVIQRVRSQIIGSSGKVQRDTSELLFTDPELARLQVIFWRL